MSDEIWSIIGIKLVHTRQYYLPSDAQQTPGISQ